MQISKQTTKKRTKN